MKIIVNGQQAVMKKGSSFEYLSENPLFTEAEDYSFDIEFPMKDCPQNILIFGALHVKGMDISTVTFPCEITTGSFNKSGILTITEVNYATVKGQFLEGMSQNNFASAVTLNAYLNDLDFSDYDGSADTQQSYDRAMGEGWANLFVWDKNGGQPIFNTVGAMEDGIWIKRHVYLWKLLQLVCLKSNLTLDDSALQAIPMFKKVVVVNTMMPIVMDKRYGGFTPLARVLPHWKIKEFFDEVGKFFGCVFIYDSYSSKVSFVPYSSLYSMSNQLSLSVEDDFSVEMTDDETAFRGNKNYKLPDDSDPDKVNMCPWFFNKPYLYLLDEITSGDFVRRVRSCAMGYQGAISEVNDGRTLYKLSDIDKYAVITEKKEIKAEGAGEFSNPQYLFCKYEILDQFGDFREGDELGIAPCPMALRRSWQIPTDPPETALNGYAYKFAVLDMFRDKYVDWFNDEDRQPQSPIMDVLKDGEDKETEYYKKLWCVLITENESPRGYHINTRKYEADGTDYFAYIEDLELEDNYSGNLHTYPYTLSPANPDIKANASLPKVDETKLYRYKFLASSLPSATAIYVIKGKRYACLRLTAHFTDTGMSELIEGEFYEIVG